MNITVLRVRPVPVLLRYLLPLLLAASVPQGDCQTGSASPPNVTNVSQSATLRSFVPDVLENQKQIYGKFPASVAHGRHWIPVVSVLAATAALIGTDQFDAPLFRRTTRFATYNKAFSARNASLGIALAPISLYAIGLLSRRSGEQSTALLAGEAVASSEILTEVLKLSTRRERPSSIQPNGNFADSWLDSRVTNGGFPSGHTIAAVSVATIFARRYGPRHRWVPYVAYGLAGAVAFSRMSLSAHFPADVFAGAAFGYAISRFVVLHE